MGITMCSNGFECRKKYECYRYMKKEHEHRQTYANFFDECYFEEYINLYKINGRYVISKREADRRTEI